MKQSEVVNLSEQDLLDNLSALKKEYSDLKLSHAVTPIENPLLLRSKRKTIARILMEISKRKNNTTK